MSVTAALGFRAAGVACGIKQDALDLAVVAADAPAGAAAVFTTNRAPAAPVSLSRSHLAEGSGTRAVVLNSGCANSGTGREGDAVAAATAEAAAAALSCGAEQILVCSTGPIGTNLDTAAVRDGVAAAVAALSNDERSGLAAARAIMTTDTVPKQAVHSGRGYRIGGMAKGAGMVRPDMATMLAVITTDAAVAGPDLDEALRLAVDQSFHSLNIDGCQSTNDTVIALASGAAGVSPEPEEFALGLGAVCRELARAMAEDAEGASRVVTLNVVGAGSDRSARRMAMAVADSALVRASFYGGDPNWGRILGALGAGPEPFAPEEFAASYQGIMVAHAGVAVPFDADALGVSMREGDIAIDVRVGSGPGSASVLTTDLTPDYVVFNGEPS